VCLFAQPPIIQYKNETDVQDEVVLSKFRIKSHSILLYRLQSEIKFEPMYFFMHTCCATVIFFSAKCSHQYTDGLESNGLTLGDRWEDNLVQKCK
jgi:hypothetical protein